jgi:hypothetical protein
MAYDDLFFRIHALERMLEYDILDVEVREVLELADVIESGIDKFGMPTSLYLGFINKRPLHVATVDEHEARRTEIVTVYEATLDRWEPGFRTRRRL